jgi:hypothetical protein
MFAQYRLDHAVIGIVADARVNPAYLYAAQTAVGPKFIGPAA